MHSTILIIVLVIININIAFAEKSVYKYQDEDGRWHFTDKKPDTQKPIKLEVKKFSENSRARVHVIYVDKSKELIAKNAVGFKIVNDYYIPIEVEVNEEDKSYNVKTSIALPETFIIPAKSSAILFEFYGDKPYRSWNFVPKIEAILGDPSIIPDDYLYRLPFASGESYLITQGFKGSFSHTHPQSLYAVDFAMAEGEAICAARDGIVIEIAEDHLLGGISKDLIFKANFVRVLHQDGTMALYAHLKPGSVIYSVGGRLAQGECFAKSGNTGYSTGPHLHFAIQRNTGMQLESIPFYFTDAQGNVILPQKGQRLSY